MKEFKFLGLEGDINEGQITQIYVKVGDNVKQGQDLFELEADKLSQAITADGDAVIGVINFKVGDIIKKGDVFASTQVSISPSTITPPVANATPTTENETVLTTQTNQRRTLATPLARSIAREMGIDINTIKGTGPDGRVLKSDILASKETQQKASIQPQVQESGPINLSTSNKTRRVKMSAMRRAIAKAMVNSKSTIPHTSLMNEVDVTALVELRTQLKNSTDQENKTFKLTYMPFFVRAVVMALQEFPILNASMDVENQEIVYHDYYHIGMATDTADGLIVPVIKDADEKNIFQLAHSVTDLAVRARDKQIKSDELKGSTFTITNYGSVGLDFGTPVINFPESAILGIGVIRKKPIVNKAGQIVIADMLPLSISIDHRIIDGADAGRFMKRLKELLEAPLTIIMANAGRR